MFPTAFISNLSLSRDFFPPGASQDPTGKQCKCFHSQMNFLALISLGKVADFCLSKFFFPTVKILCIVFLLD